MKHRKFLRFLLIVAFTAYSLLLVYLLFFKNRVPSRSYLEHLKYAYNIVPFKTVAYYFTRLEDGRIDFLLFVKNIAGNLAAFLPMGVFLPHFFNEGKKTLSVILGVGIICAVEIIQYFSTLGSFDIDDVILNSLGLLAGYAGFVLLSKISACLNKRKRAQSKDVF